MNQRLYSQIYAHLLDYLVQSTSLEEFRDWFDSFTWDLHTRSAEPDAGELAAEIELRLSEFASGHWTEKELRELLKPLVLTYAESQTPWGHSGASVRSSSSAVTLSPISAVVQTTDLERPAGIRASVEFV